MAKLLSEDQEFISSIELAPLSVKDLNIASCSEPQIWQSISLTLKSGHFLFSMTNTESCLICRSPQDEIKGLIDFLNKLIAKHQNKVIFEPHEPSFDFSFERTTDDGIFVHAWIDASNTTNDFYSGDAAGVRFHTNEKLLKSFIEELQNEFFDK